MRLRKKKWTTNFINDNPDILLSKNKKYSLKKIFRNENPIYLEIGCGKGNFAIVSSYNNQNINYVALEKDKTSVCFAARNMKDNFDFLTNLVFLNGYAEDIRKYFPRQKFDRIYLNFSDPWPKKRHAKRRLMFNNYLKIYHKILNKNGTIEFKTDSTLLYEWSLEECGKVVDRFDILYHTIDLYSDEDFLQGNVQSEYEKKFNDMGITIKKIILQKK